MAPLRFELHVPGVHFLWQLTLQLMPSIRCESVDTFGGFTVIEDTLLQRLRVLYHLLVECLFFRLARLITVVWNWRFVLDPDSALSLLVITVLSISNRRE